jgi:ADP-ribosylglycohydrolase
VRNASGALFGLAYGDSLGKPTEFQTYAEIVAEYGPAGPRALQGQPALVTDDTQMMLAVGEALLATPAMTPEALEPVLRQAFLEWAISPDNNRAPGMTCLRACGNLSDGRPWQQATQINSKGCGANMRVLPVGLMPGLSDTDRAGIAQLQAAMTHGHPTALAASELTAFAPLWLQAGLAPTELLGELRKRCDDQRGRYNADWLGDLYPAEAAADRMAAGWDECAAALDRVAAALRDRVPGDPCLATGAGWIAEEALATALYCYLLSPDDPVEAIARGATSSGDSDSIACLAGSFAGAALGLAAWPEQWHTQIEYFDRLTRLATAWD